MNTNATNYELQDIVLMSDSAGTRDSVALVRRSASESRFSFYRSEQGETADDTQPNEHLSDTFEQQAEPPSAGSEIRNFTGKAEAIYGIIKPVNESVTNALLSAERIKSTRCFLALVENRIQLIIKDEKIELQTTDVIVNSTKPNLKIRGIGIFNIATVSRAISRAVGSAAVSALRRNYPDGIGFGEIATGDPGRLQCKQLFHVAIEKYGGARNDAKVETLKRVVYTCLKRAEEMGYTSITFPAIGTGKLDYPPRLVAETMLGCFVNYAKTQINTSVRNIFVVTGVGCGGPVHEAFKHEETRRKVSFLGVSAANRTIVDPPEGFCPAYLHITAHSQEEITAIFTELNRVQAN